MARTIQEGGGRCGKQSRAAQAVHLILGYKGQCRNATPHSSRGEWRPSGSPIPLTLMDWREKRSTRENFFCANNNKHLKRIINSDRTHVFFDLLNIYFFFHFLDSSIFIIGCIFFVLQTFNNFIIFLKINHYTCSFHILWWSTPYTLSRNAFQINSTEVFSIWFF